METTLPVDLDQVAKCPLLAKHRPDQVAKLAQLTPEAYFVAKVDGQTIQAADGSGSLRVPADLELDEICGRIIPADGQRHTLRLILRDVGGPLGNGNQAFLPAEGVFTVHGAQPPEEPGAPEPAPQAPALAVSPDAAVFGIATGLNREAMGHVVTQANGHSDTVIALTGKVLELSHNMTTQARERDQAMVKMVEAFNRGNAERDQRLSEMVRQAVEAAGHGGGAGAAPPSFTDHVEGVIAGLAPFAGVAGKVLDVLPEELINNLGGAVLGGGGGGTGAMIRERLGQLFEMVPDLAADFFAAKMGGGDFDFEDLEDPASSEAPASEGASEADAA